MRLREALGILRCDDLDIGELQAEENAQNRAKHQECKCEDHPELGDVIATPPHRPDRPPEHPDHGDEGQSSTDGPLDADRVGQVD